MEPVNFRWNKDNKCFEWSHIWSDCEKDQVRIESYNDNIRIIFYDKKIILECQYKEFRDFKDLSFQLKELSRREDLPQIRIILRDFLYDFTRILDQPCFLPDEKSRTCLSLALFDLILEENRIVDKEELQEFYDVMDISRKKVICYYKERVGKRRDEIMLVHHLCLNWIEAFIDYSKYWIKYDPEVEIWKIIDENCNSKTSWHNPEFYKFWNGNHMDMGFLDLAKKITDWYSDKRYNIVAMTSLLNQQQRIIRNRRGEEDDIKVLAIFGSLVENYWYICALVILIVPIILGMSFQNDTLTKVSFSVLFVILFATILYFVIYTAVKKNLYWFRKIIPRLLGSIIVGYVPLVMTGDMWKFCLKIPCYLCFVICFIGIMASLFYIFVEINKALNDECESKNKKTFYTSFTRSLRITCIGIAESLAVGYILCSLFSYISIVTGANKCIGADMGNLSRYVDDIPIIPGLFKSWDTWTRFHTVYPSVLITYFSLALFIGIFLQIIWEDKPITKELQ